MIASSDNSWTSGVPCTMMRENPTLGSQTAQKMKRYVRRVFQKKERKEGGRKIGRKKERGREGGGKKRKNKKGGISRKLIHFSVPSINYLLFI